MTKKNYLETFKGCARSLCFPLLIVFSFPVAFNPSRPDPDKEKKINVNFYFNTTF